MNEHTNDFNANLRRRDCKMQILGMKAILYHLLYTYQNNPDVMIATMEQLVTTENGKLEKYLESEIKALQTENLKN